MTRRKQSKKAAAETQRDRQEVAREWKATKGSANAARAHWATMTPDEQVAALRAGRTPFASKKGDSVQRYRDAGGKKGEVYRSRKAVSSGFETNRRKH